MLKDRTKAFKKINLYPPLIGAGIKVTGVNADFTEIDVTLRLTWWNRNIVGTSFGGSLYMMCDPFYMAILMTNLGRDYIVWDKAARIDFLKPGRTDVMAKFAISPDEIAAIRKQADTNPKVEPEFTAEIRDKNNVIVAKVHKTLYVRRKDTPKP
jgi:acyl-coenzyme A thioesterase PaaI-like protein